MAQYISKDSLIEKLEEEIKHIYAGREYVGISSNEENIVRGIQMAEDIVDTLEVKDVDLEREIDGELKTRWAGEYLNTEKFYESAKHFFELGIKAAQKGE